jgi:hypothetical protein
MDIRNPMGMDMDMNFYPWIYSRADIIYDRGYDCGRIFSISDPNPTRCHP